MRKLCSILLFVLSAIYLPFYITVFSFILFLYLNNKIAKYIPIIGYLILLFFQISTTRVATNFEFSGYQNFIHQQQLDSYPPQFFRIGNIVETKISSPQITRFLQNLFDCFDLVSYFKNYFLTILFIPFVIGVIKLINNPHKLFINLFLVSIILLTFISPEGKFGPVLLLPFIVNIISFYSCEK